MADYNYSSFSSDDYEFRSFRGPAVGDRVPDLTLRDADGRPKRLLDFEGELLVLETGSITCPLFQSRRGGMARLDPRVSSAVLYVREAHPGASIPNHMAMDDKLACAQTLRSDGEGRTVVVDDLEGTAHSALGSMPNSVFIINRRGCVVFRAAWNNPAATARAVEQLLAGETATAKSWFRPPLPPVAVRTLRDSGAGAAWDFFGSLPMLVWHNLIVRNLRVCFGSTGSVAADVSC